MWCGQLSFNWSLSSIRNYSSFDKIRATPWLERKGGKTQLAYWLSGGGNKRCIDARCLFSCNSQFVQLLSLFVLEQSRQVRPMTNAVPPLWEGKKLDSRDKVSCIIFERYLMRISSDTWKTHKKNRFFPASVFPRWHLGQTGLGG